MIFQANAIFMKSSKEKAQITAGRFGDFIANLKGISVTKLGYPKVHVQTQNDARKYIFASRTVLWY